MKENKLIRIEARVTNKEMQEILAKAALYTKSNVSELIRESVLNFKPIKKVGK